jgi:hypothetical protein
LRRIKTATTGAIQPDLPKEFSGCTLH